MGTRDVSFPSRETLLAKAKGILDSYAGVAVTVRQLYYRLVAAAAFANRVQSYKNLVAALTDWRRSGEIGVEAFEDRTRGMKQYDIGWRTDDPEGWMLGYFEDALSGSRGYSLAKWYGQPKRVVVAVEKQALEGPFESVCMRLGVDLAVCRGYPSLSFLSEIAGSLDPESNDEVGDRENVVIYFGDHDPSGANIPEVVERDLSDFFGQSFEFEHVALHGDQARQMRLIPAPAKVTDSRTVGFVAEHGQNVYELDAVEPRELRAMIERAILKHWDTAAGQERDRRNREGRETIERYLKDANMDEIVEKLRKAAKKKDGYKDKDDKDDDENP